ncbi:hypothetical protein K469DRAFT_617820 [Zopfia rhizophila CBS 207.26]|uniref:Zn(2)-C6 fungal-type domain-containing protein n=1 Tax=Zopfia rhizophila CBS 207.26 TaxID=1314779 RepID=A0A6A6ER29_9PEZI|nr:hypothetical protein K469DRAFT_617820 [Zopfia rhizophila CBS 207.26]
MDEASTAYTKIEAADTPTSPKRKKVRAKYAPRACVSCRRSKLKCSGENPCQRCLDNGRRCFYSEDQTAAEALQNLSRPTTTHPAPQNGNGIARRSILPRQESVERRASNVGLAGLTMEARMTRIEGMMEALVQEGGARVLLRGSAEQEEVVSAGFQGDTAFQAPIEPFNTSPAPVRQQLGFQQDNAWMNVSPESRHSIPAVSPASGHELTSGIQVGSRNLTFPNPVDYQKYIEFFFADINPYHPCVNEAEFRARSERMFSSRTIQTSDICILALNYIIFAFSDIVVDTSPGGGNSRPPGWQWFQLADELVGKRTISGRGNLSLIQFLIYEALYLTHADRPNTAYNVIGLACRLCFQFALHQQPCWENCTAYETHMRQRTFWTVYFTDRRIALSCGRPYGIRDLDIDVEQPAWIYDGDLHPERPLPEPDVSRSSNMYLSCMISWAKLGGDVWDQVFAAGAAKRGVDGENTAILEARIKHWTDAVLPTTPLLPPDQPPDVRHLRQHVLVHTRLNHLRLLLRRRTMVSLKYDGNTGSLCGDLASDIVQKIKAHSPEARIPSSFRFHVTASLGSALLILTTLLVRDLAPIGLQDRQPAYAESFREGIAILNDLAAYLQVARRVTEDLKDIVQVVTSMLEQRQVVLHNQQDGGSATSNITNLFPYTALDSVQQAGLNEYQGGFGIWNGADAPLGSSETWDFEVQPARGGYGVPWI